MKKNFRYVLVALYAALLCTISYGAWQSTHADQPASGFDGSTSGGISGVATLANAKIWVGDGSNVAQERTPSGDWTMSNTGVATLANTAVTPAAYVLAGFTVDSKGRLTAAASATLASTNFWVGNGGSVPTAVAMSGDATMANTGAVTLANTAVTPAAYTLSSVTVDSKGRLTAAASATLASTNFWVGNGSSVPTAVAMSSDATMSNTGAVTIANSAITNAKMANMATLTVKGNVTGGSAAPTDLSKTELTTLINAFTSGLSGAAPASGGGTTNFLRADGSWAAPATGGGFTISAKAGNFTASDGANYYYRISATATATLPASPADGSVRRFKVTGGTTTFALNGAETINHADGVNDQVQTLESGDGVFELTAVTGGWDET